MGQWIIEVKLGQIRSQVRNKRLEVGTVLFPFPRRSQRHCPLVRPVCYESAMYILCGLELERAWRLKTSRTWLRRFASSGGYNRSGTRQSSIDARKKDCGLSIRWGGILDESTSRTTAKSDGVDGLEAVVVDEK